MLRLIFCAALLVVAVSASRPVGFSVEESVNYTSIAKGKYGGELFEVNDSFYAAGDKVLLVDVRGTRQQMGFDWGYLVGKQSDAAFGALMKSIIGERSYLLPVLNVFMDWQWRSYLSKQVPEEFMEEIEALEDGGRAAGVKGLKNKITRGIVMANVPSDLDDLKAIILQELHLRTSLLPDEEMNALETMLDAINKGHVQFGMGCSMFAVWGSRTVNGNVYSARNLDWSKDTGVSHAKLVSVFHPINKHAHATIGFAGLFGALAGMSEMGMSVHEANLEEKPNTFNGFPWVIRLRYIMENADSLASAEKLWLATNNTVGFNHMATSARDAALTPHGAVVFETMAGFTATFHDNDDREANAVRIDPKTNTSVHIGQPLDHALWRTNNGFDPESIKLYQWSLDGGAGKDSEHRYMLIHDAIVAYNTSGQLMGHLEAINITSIVGSKGEDFFVCQQPYDDGSNVLSVTFAPSEGVFYAAWENGTGKTWTPACCNAYVRFDMQYWFSRH